MSLGGFPPAENGARLSSSARGFHKTETEKNCNEDQESDCVWDDLVRKHVRESPKG